MTLGGLALAVGILVDDATVTIENINYHLEQGEDVEEAILNGAHEIALPALVSTLAICIVFVPMFMLAGIARFLFVPLAEAVVFAMLASYVLSRTLVPTLAKYWLKKHDPHAGHRAGGLFVQVQQRFERGFARMREGYIRLARACAQRRAAFRAAVPGRDGGHGPAGVSVWTLSAGSGPGLLPERGCRADQAASARSHRHAHRGDGHAVRPGGGHHPRRDSGARDRHHRRQHRRALQRHQPDLLDLRAGRLRAMPTSSSASRKTTVPTARLRARAAQQADRAVSRRRCLLSCRRTSSARS